MKAKIQTSLTFNFNKKILNLSWLIIYKSQRNQSKFRTKDRREKATKAKEKINIRKQTIS